MTHSYQMFVDGNYKNLSIISKRWGKGHWAEMLSAYVIYLEKNWNKDNKSTGKSLLIMNNTERMKFSQIWMKNQSGFRKNGEWYKDIRINNFEEIWDFDFEDTGEDHRINIYAEDCSIDMREWIADIHNGFSDEEVNKILMVTAAYSQLQLRDKILYDMYITEGLSMRDIAARIRIPLTSVHIEIKSLKNKILNLCKN